MRNVVAGLSGGALKFAQLFGMSLLCVRKAYARSCLQQAWGWPAPYSSRCDFFKSVFLSLLLTFNAQAKACLALWQKPCLSVTPHVQISGDLCCIPIGD